MLYYKKTSEHLVIKGKTFHAKDYLKAIGAKWDSVQIAWILPVHLDSTNLRKELEEKVEKGLLDAALAEKADNGSYPWICCKECKVYDWVRQFTSCKVHSSGEGIGKITFRVKGRLYTGD
jgi:hypothetical protein